MKRSSGQDVTLLDHGPIFQLATLHGFGSGSLPARLLRRSWANILRQWADTLDIVIWLNAPDDLLAKRIRTRETWHILQKASDQEALEYLSRYRASFEHVIAELTAMNEMMVLRFDTSHDSPQYIADQVLETLKGIGQSGSGGTQRVTTVGDLPTPREVVR